MKKVKRTLTSFNFETEIFKEFQKNCAKNNVNMSDVFVECMKQFNLVYGDRANDSTKPLEYLGFTVSPEPPKIEVEPKAHYSSTKEMNDAREKMLPSLFSDELE